MIYEKGHPLALIYFLKLLRIKSWLHWSGFINLVNVCILLSFFYFVYFQRNWPFNSTFLAYEEQREATRLAITNRSIFASSKKSSDQSTECISRKKNQIKIKDNNADAFSSPSSFQGPSSARKQLGIVIKSPSNRLTKSNFESQEVTSWFFLLSHIIFSFHLFL